MKNQQQNQRQEIINDLLSQFDGAWSVSTAQLAKVKNQSEQGIRNMIAEGTFEIPSYIDGGKRRFDIRDVAEWLDRKREESRGKPRGRPTKAEEVRRRMA